MDKRDLEKILIKLQKYDKIVIKKKNGEHEIVETDELEITRLAHTFINGTKLKDFIDDSTYAFYERAISWTVAKHNGLHSYIIETTENYNEDVLSYGVVSQA